VPDASRGGAAFGSTIPTGDLPRNDSGLAANRVRQDGLQKWYVVP
jgi:hypothetical protein